MITGREWAWPLWSKELELLILFLLQFSFQHNWNVLNIKLTFVRRRCSLFPATNVKYECCLKDEDGNSLKPKTFFLVKATIDTSWFDNDPHTSFKPLWRPLVSEVIVNMRVNWCHDSIRQDFSPIQTCKTRPKYFHIAIYKGFDLWFSAVASMFMFVVALSGPKLVYTYWRYSHPKLPNSHATWCCRKLARLLL